MKKNKWMVGILVCVFLSALMVVTSSSAADGQGAVVGRVYHIEGELLRYISDENDWVAVVKDAPFGEEDTLYSGNKGKAELIIPNGTWVRIGNNTQVQFIDLNGDISEIDVGTGIARFYNKGSDTVIKVTSPFGYVQADPGTVFDFYVGENSAEVIAVKGDTIFVHSATDTQYDVLADGTSILADQNQVSSGEESDDPDWERWNVRRESLWAMKSRTGGRSAEYLPPNLRDQAYDLEENGTWEDVPYDGETRRFWRPTRVAVGWSPFTVGRWTDYYGDQCWVPAEPFGYVTHHYGNWIYVRNFWYWAPPVVSVRVGLPLLNIGYFWNPGRVSWIHHDNYVGWVPLAPRERYYSHRNWRDPHNDVVTNVNINQINIIIGNQAYANHAVIVRKDNFSRVNNYRDHRETNINKATIINQYRSAPVVNNTVINNYTTNRQRYDYTDVTVKKKPHNTVVNRIQKNEKIIKEGNKESADLVHERVKKIPEGNVNKEVRVETPKSKNYIVPVTDVKKPISELQLQQKEIKPLENVRNNNPPEILNKSKDQSVKPGESTVPSNPPETTAPIKREKPGKVERPGLIKPDKTNLPEGATIANPPVPAAPVKREQPVKIERPEGVKPAITVTPEGTTIANPPETTAPIKRKKPSRLKEE